MTGGCAVLDYDRDGLLDILLIKGAAIRTDESTTQRVDKFGSKYWNRLHRNPAGGNSKASGSGRVGVATATARVSRPATAEDVARGPQAVTELMNRCDLQARRLGLASSWRVVLNWPDSYTSTEEAV